MCLALGQRACLCRAHFGRKVQALWSKSSGSLLTLGIVGQVGAAKSDSLVRFEGGIGVIPVSSAPGQQTQTVRSRT